MMWAGYVASIGEEKCIQGCGEKARRKEVARKT
jgi:hypothetical protein